MLRAICCTQAGPKGRLKKRVKLRRINAPRVSGSIWLFHMSWHTVVPAAHVSLWASTHLRLDGTARPHLPQIRHPPCLLLWSTHSATVRPNLAKL